MMSQSNMMSQPDFPDDFGPDFQSQSDDFGYNAKRDREQNHRIGKPQHGPGSSQSQGFQFSQVRCQSFVPVLAFPPNCDILEFSALLKPFENDDKLSPEGIKNPISLHR